MTRVGILAISDTRSRHERKDTSTDQIRHFLENAGFVVSETHLVPDEIEQICALLVEFADIKKLPVIITAGGTGFGPRDVTPEATRRVIEREAPGLAEAMRMRTSSGNPLAWLSRATAGLRGRSLIVNLPGNPDGAIECLRVIVPLLPHALSMIRGEGHTESACEAHSHESSP